MGGDGDRIYFLQHVRQLCREIGSAGLRVEGHLDRRP